MMRLKRKEILDRIAAGTEDDDREDGEDRLCRINIVPPNETPH